MIRTQTITRMVMVSVLATSVALSLAGSAHGQAQDQKKIMVQVGGGYLLNSDARAATSTTAVHAGLGYIVPAAGQGVTSGSSSIDLDYNQNTGHGNKLSAIGLYIAQRMPVSQNKTSKGGLNPYFGGAFGVVQLQAQGSGTQQSAIAHATTKTTDKKTGIGGKVMAGLDFGGAFAELPCLRRPRCRPGPSA